MSKLEEVKQNILDIKVWIDNVMVDEWWSNGNETFKTYAERLLKQGLDYRFVQSMLSDLYYAVSGEFGN